MAPIRHRNAAQVHRKQSKQHFVTFSPLAFSFSSSRLNINYDRNQMFLGAAYFMTRLFVVVWSSGILLPGRLGEFSHQRETNRNVLSCWLGPTVHREAAGVWCSTKSHLLFIYETLSKVLIKKAFIDTLMTSTFRDALSPNSLQTSFCILNICNNLASCKRLMFTVKAHLLFFSFFFVERTRNSW